MGFLGEEKDEPAQPTPFSLRHSEGIMVWEAGLGLAHLILMIPLPETLANPSLSFLSLHKMPFFS